MPTRLGETAMKIVFVFFAGILTAMAAQQQFALNGQKLGQTKQEFLKSRPSATCNSIELIGRTGPDDEVCVIRDGIEFAGYRAVFDSGCDVKLSDIPDGKNCYCGLFAFFQRQKLSTLLITIDPRGDAASASKVISDVLAKQYGEPGPSLHWTNDSESLSIFRSDLPVGPRKIHLVTVRLAMK